MKYYEVSDNSSVILLIFLRSLTKIFKRGHCENGYNEKRLSSSLSLSSTGFVLLQKILQRKKAEKGKKKNH